MSGKIQGAIYGRELTRTQMLVALAMADHADHDGHGVRPAQATIAWKIGISTRQVQRTQAELRDLGVLEVTKKAGRSSPTEYDVVPEAVPLRPRKDDTQTPKGRHPELKVAISDDKGRHPDVVQTVHIEPSTITVLETIARPEEPTLKDQHNQMMQTIVAAMGWREDEVAEAMWGEVRKASKALRDLGVDPWGNEVARRARIYLVNQPGKLSPMALVKWWADCAQPRIKPDAKDVRMALRRQQMDDALRSLR